jgi:TolB-like protein/tetratricopeptide (TPR) repeat protein
VLRWFRKQAGGGAPSSIGHYRIVGTLGAGGMGVVYSAVDERLGRGVAIKMIRPASQDPKAVQRLWREARSAARVSHPNICQVHEIGELLGEPYIVMELLEGETLTQRLAQGPLAPGQSLPIALELLEALGALHRHGLLHRDLKPANVFLTAHGVKLLDFGLVSLTATGAVVGTPRYMSPEQLQGLELDPRSDLFTLGAILFEMLAGRPAFEGATGPAIFEAILRGPAPALAGAELQGLSLVIGRAMANRPEQRYPSAEAMARELRALLARSAGTSAPQAARRLLVLPFRVLRPDPEIDFLSFSLADALAASLSGLDDLLVRSTLAGARFGAEAGLDLSRIAREADVDHVLAGTLLRAADELRVTVQLVEVPAGTLLWSQTFQRPLPEMFALEDAMRSRVVERLSLAVSDTDQRRRDVPASARGYELYLRGNQAGLESRGWEVARDLYEECLREDPRYAPAWARLGRVYRLLDKFQNAPGALERAERAFRSALELNPDLPLAHHLYTHLEVEAGRVLEALERLLGRARRHLNDPELFVGLVHVLRYCGLLEASLAADQRARLLDPGAGTSVSYTYLALGDCPRAVAADRQELPFVRLYALIMEGRREEAITALRDAETRGLRHAHEMFTALRLALQGEREQSLARLRPLMRSRFRDPEGLYYVARTFAHLEAAEEAFGALAQIVDGGFFCAPFFRRDPWLDPLRSRPELEALLERAEQRRREAARAFQRLGGDELLRVSPPW